MKGRVHPAKVRAEVTAVLLLGAPVTETAERFGVPKQTVSRWRQALLAGPPGMRPDGTKKGDCLLTGLTLAYLETSLRSLTDQARAMADREWLQGQDAKGLALLYGCLADQAFRMLEILAAWDDAQRT